MPTSAIPRARCALPLNCAHVIVSSNLSTRRVACSTCHKNSNKSQHCQKFTKSLDAMWALFFLCGFFWYPMFFLICRGSKHTQQRRGIQKVTPANPSSLSWGVLRHTARICLPCCYLALLPLLHSALSCMRHCEGPCLATRVQSTSGFSGR
jgi:hypothetical protein